MPATLISPLADVVTFSVPGLPSEPGAPRGQSGMPDGGSAPPTEADSISTASRPFITLIFVLRVGRWSASGARGARCRSGSGEAVVVRLPHRAREVSVRFLVPFADELLLRRIPMQGTPGPQGDHDQMADDRGPVASFDR